MMLTCTGPLSLPFDYNGLGMNPTTSSMQDSARKEINFGGYNTLLTRNSHFPSVSLPRLGMDTPNQNMTSMKFKIGQDVRVRKLLKGGAPTPQWSDWKFGKVTGRARNIEQREIAYDVYSVEIKESGSARSAVSVFSDHLCEIWDAEDEIPSSEFMTKRFLAYYNIVADINLTPKRRSRRYQETFF